jgi:hypothetical protein
MLTVSFAPVASRLPLASRNIAYAVVLPMSGIISMTSATPTSIGPIDRERRLPDGSC